MDVCIAATSIWEVPFQSAAGPHYAGTPSRPRNWRPLHRSQPPPQGWRGLNWTCVGRHYAGPPSRPRKWR
eukprot:2059752-Pyramimonas_sp.AAC.1